MAVLLPLVQHAREQLFLTGQHLLESRPLELDVPVLFAIGQVLVEQLDLLRLGLGLAHLLLDLLQSVVREPVELALPWVEHLVCVLLSSVLGHKVSVELLSQLGQHLLFLFLADFQLWNDGVEHRA